MEKNNTPALRFKEFTGTWVLERLGDNCNIFAGGTPSTSVSDYWEKGDIPWIPSGNVQDCVIKEKDVKTKITKKGLDNSSAKLIKPNTALLAMTGATCGKSGFLTFQSSANQSVMAFETEKFDSKFLYYVFQSNKQNILKHQAGGAQAGINKDTCENFEFLFPLKNEQTKISEMLSEIDNLIELSTNKKISILNIKESALCKLLATKENVPSLRFKEFSDDWKSYKLGDLIKEFYNGQTPYRANQSFWNGNINWLSSGELNRGLVLATKEKITTAGQKDARLRIVEKGTFVMAITGLEAVGTRGNCGILGIDTTLNQSCMALYPFEGQLSPNFIFQWYRMVGDKYGQEYTQGTKQQSYTADILKSLPIKKPDNINEQIKLSSFLSDLDRLAVLYDNKIEKLMKIKNTLLSKMLIQGME